MNQTTDHHNPVEKKVKRLLSPFEAFMQSQVSTGIFLLIAAVLALGVANSSWHDFYEALRHWEFGFHLQNWRLDMPLLEWVNSGLMALFFFLLGLEIKREVLAGELQKPKKLMLVLFAALGGIFVPALIFSAINYGSPTIEGWAIPVGTSAPFALGAIALLGRKKFPGLAIFLTAVAIIDDLGSVMIIGAFYTKSIAWLPLVCALGFFALLVLINISGGRRAIYYFIVGSLLWFCMLQSGLHATVAGVMVALTVPARTNKKPGKFLHRVRNILLHFEKRQEENEILSDQKQHELVMDIEQMAEKASTPLQRWESKSENLIGLMVLPIFAFFNAGIYVVGQNMTEIWSSPLILGVMAGLVLGKPLGIVFACWLAVKLGFGKLPEGTSFAHIIGAGLLAGMGFTMSFLIATLSFTEGSVLLEQAKLGILLATFTSGFLGMTWLYCVYKFKK